MGKMLKKETRVYRQLLLKLRERISEDIKHISEDTLKKSQKEASGDISGYTLHMADLATDAYDREFSFGLASNDRNALLQIDVALSASAHKKIRVKEPVIFRRYVKVPAVANLSLNFHF